MRPSRKIPIIGTVVLALAGTASAQSFDRVVYRVEERRGARELTLTKGGTIRYEIAGGAQREWRATKIELGQVDRALAKADLATLPERIARGVKIEPCRRPDLPVRTFSIEIESHGAKRRVEGDLGGLGDYEARVRPLIHALSAIGGSMDMSDPVREVRGTVSAEGTLAIVDEAGGRLLVTGARNDALVTLLEAARGKEVRVSARVTPKLGAWTGELEVQAIVGTSSRAVTLTERPRKLFAGGIAAVPAGGTVEVTSVRDEYFEVVSGGKVGYVPRDAISTSREPSRTTGLAGQLGSR